MTENVIYNRETKVLSVNILVEQTLAINKTDEEQFLHLCYLVSIISRLGEQART